MIFLAAEEVESKSLAERFLVIGASFSSGEWDKGMAEEILAPGSITAGAELGGAEPGSRKFSSLSVNLKISFINAAGVKSSMPELGRERGINQRREVKLDETG